MNVLVSAKCMVVLDKGPICADGFLTFIEQRRYAMCRAFELLEKSEVDSLGEGIRKAWSEIRVACPR